MSGQEMSAVLADDVMSVPGLKLVAGGMQIANDAARGEVRVSLWGGNRARAVYRTGRGCTLIDSGTVAPLAPWEAFAADPLAAHAAPIMPSDERMVAAMDRLFAEPDRGPRQRVKALVVVWNGRILAERYAPGYGPDTPLPGWSLSKSVVNALFGVLVRKGEIDVRASAPVAQWQAPGDPRAAVTVEDLLRQVSGQPFGHSNTGFDRASQMLFLASDTAAVAAGARFARADAGFSYTDANYAILSGILRARLGEPQAIADFATRELFGPLGMRTAGFAFDAAGNPQGSAFVHASARDWARFGLLYADNGVVGGQRVLPDDWVAWTSRPTVGARPGYGAGFWTNVGDSPGAVRRRSWGAPADSFFASGNLGQAVLVVPSAGLVVVRMGASGDDGAFSMERTTRFAAEVLELMRGRRSAEQLLPDAPLR